MKITQFIVTAVFVLFGLTGPGVGKVDQSLGDNPRWWRIGGLGMKGISSNYSPATIGQLKNMAHHLYDEVYKIEEAIQRLPEERRERIGLPKLGFTKDDLFPPPPEPVTDEWKREQHAMANLGQLKAISYRFYDFLHKLDSVWLDKQLQRNGTKVVEGGGRYPWNPGTSVEDNKVPINLGQLKAVFSLRVRQDSDNDGLSDLIEVVIGTHPLISDTDLDGMSDGIEYYRELVEGSDRFNPLVKNDDSLVLGVTKDDSNRLSDPDGRGLDHSLEVNLVGEWDFEFRDRTFDGFQNLQQNYRYFSLRENRVGDFVLNPPGPPSNLVEVPLLPGGSNKGISSKAAVVGANDYLWMSPTVLVMQGNTYESALSFWFKIDADEITSPDGMQLVGSSSLNSFGYVGLGVGIRGDGRITMIQGNGPGRNYSKYHFDPVGPKKNISDGRWHHMMIDSRKFDSPRVYLDGAKVVDFRFSSQGGNIHGLGQTDGHITFGKMSPIPFQLSGGFQSFEGKFDRIRLYRKSLGPAAATAFYLQDSDGDGLYDYYESSYFPDKVLTPNPEDLIADPDGDGLKGFEEQMAGTNPFDRDTDRDNLPDWYEVKYGLNPTFPDGGDDLDRDGLSNLEEYIHGSLPNDPDSDDDLTGDGVEVDQGSLPNDPADGGLPLPGEVMILKLGVGDPSESNSERYALEAYELETNRLILTHVSEQAGVVSFREYKQFRRGQNYYFKIRHLGSAYQPGGENEPDYDYFSEVAFVNPAQQAGYRWFDAYDPATGQVLQRDPPYQRIVLESEYRNGKPYGTGGEDVKDFPSTIAYYHAILTTGEPPSVENNPQLTLSFDHPFSDDAVNVPGDLEVFAGCEVHLNGVYINSVLDNPNALNKVIGVPLVALVDDAAVVEKIEWLVEADDNNGCSTPRILDQLSPGPPRDATDWVELAEPDDGYAAVVVDYTFKRADGSLTAKAGDGFTVKARITIKDEAVGENMPKEIIQEKRFKLSPGRKCYHVAIDPSIEGREAQFVAQIGAMHGWSEQQFEQTFKDYRSLTPKGSKEQKEFIVYCFDEFRNPIEEGVDVGWRLNGGGVLGEPAPDSELGDGTAPSDSTAVHESKVGPNGRASIKFTQTFYPSCPFSPEMKDSDLKSAVEIQVDQGFAPAGLSVVAVDKAPVAEVGEVVIRDLNGSWQNPLLDKKETRQLSAIVAFKVGNREIPLSGVEVVCTSTNGKLAEHLGVATTDAFGVAKFTLTAKDAQVGELECIAAFNDKSVLLTPKGARWIVSPGSPYMVPDYEIITGNKTTDGIICVDALEDVGESLVVPGAVEGDQKLKVPVKHRTKITINGDPNHEYTIFADSSVASRSGSSASSFYNFKEAVPVIESGGVIANRFRTMSDGGDVAMIEYTAKMKDYSPGPSKGANYLRLGIPFVPIGFIGPLTAEQQGWRNYVPHNSSWPLGLNQDQNQDQNQDPHTMCVFSDNAARSLLRAPNTQMEMKLSLWSMVDSYKYRLGPVFDIESLRTYPYQTLVEKSDDFRISYRFVGNRDAMIDNTATFDGEEFVDFKLEFNVRDEFGVVQKKVLTSERIPAFDVLSLRLQLISRPEGVVLRLTEIVGEGLLGGKTYFDDGVSYLFRTGEELAGSEGNVVLKSIYEKRIYSVGFKKYDFSASSVKLEGLTSQGTVWTDADGKGHFYLTSKGTMADDQIEPEKIVITATGSRSFSTTVWSCTDWLKGRLIACGKAFLKGTEGLGEDAKWYEKAMAWASESIPFVSDLKTLAFEIYKGATGCDRVDGLNVTFAAVSLIVDIATLGAGSAITKPAKAAMLAGKAALKSMGTGIAIGAVADIAINAYIKRLSQEAAKGGGEDEPWVNNSEAFLKEIKDVGELSGDGNKGLREAFGGSLGSVQDAVDMAEMHKELGSDLRGLFMEVAQ